jgi:redox-sensitive bicupin YhaK (pirin superfamily)
MSTSTPTTTPASDTLRSRPVVRVVSGQPTSDGAGVRLTRVIGTQALSYLDPFLMLDEFGSDDPAAYIAGFPDHPHRGFETITYMLDGRMRHRDNHGNEGLLTAGAVQWMTAGRGIVHSEMPEQERGRMRGFQLWLNLPADEKMRPVEYQDIVPERVPAVALAGGGSVKVIAGSYSGVVGPAPARTTQPLYLDVTLPAGGVFDTPVDAGKAAFLYVYEGTVVVGPGATAAVAAPRLAELGAGERVEVRATAAARFLVIAGRPVREPVARYGPFVMNTEAEIHQAISDFQQGKF